MESLVFLLYFALIFQFIFFKHKEKEDTSDKKKVTFRNHGILNLILSALCNVIFSKLLNDIMSTWALIAGFIACLLLLMVGTSYILKWHILYSMTDQVK